MRTFPGCVLPVLGSLALVGLVAAAGCEPEVPGTVDGTCDPDRAAEVTSSDYFESVMKPQVFEPYCSHCHWSTRVGGERHGAPIGLDYDTEEGANQRQSTTWFRVSTYDMPPMGRVPNLEEMALLNEWLNCSVDATLGDDDDSGQGDDDDSAR